MGRTVCTAECRYDETGCVVKPPAALPVDVEFVSGICDDINHLNRSERRCVHQHLLEVARDADDKSLCNNENIVACRMRQDEHDAIVEWCQDHQTTLSAFARDAVRERFRRVARQT